MVMGIRRGLSGPRTLVQHAVHGHALLMGPFGFDPALEVLAHGQNFVGFDVRFILPLILSSHVRVGSDGNRTMDLEFLRSTVRRLAA